MWAGLIGYGTIVGFFVLVSVFTGRSVFYVPALFGATLFFGLEDPAALAILPGPVLTYNMVHLLVFLAFGAIASWLVAGAERYAVLRYSVVFILIFVAAHTYAALMLFARPLLGGSAWWQVGVAGLLAAVGMGWYLLAVHPGLRRQLRSLPLGDEP
jgi:hypothetical protein